MRYSFLFPLWNKSILISIWMSKTKIIERNNHIINIKMNKEINLLLIFKIKNLMVMYTFKVMFFLNYKNIFTILSVHLWNDSCFKNQSRKQMHLKKQLFLRYLNKQPKKWNIIDTVLLFENMKFDMLNVNAYSLFRGDVNYQFIDQNMSSLKS
jgi:hypothetical protein